MSHSPELYTPGGTPIIKTLTKKFLKISLIIYSTFYSLSQAAVIIQYHHIDSETPAVTSVTPAQFKQHMDYLAGNKFTVWPLPKLINALQNNAPLPSKVIAISFDDGYASVYQHALPIMRRYDFPFTVFINTDRIGGDGFMSWQQLRELGDDGATIANHTTTHSHLLRKHAAESETQWQQRIKNDIRRAETTIIKQLGHSPGFLAYPYGEYNHSLEKIVKQLGMIAFAQHSGAFNHQVNWQVIPRFAFNQEYAEMDGFINKVNSLAMPIESISVIDSHGNKLHDPVLPENTYRPQLVLLLESSDIASKVQCFATGQGQIKTTIKNRRVISQPDNNLPVGRSRINCTAPSNQAGRFYWYSEFFMRKTDDNQWYEEP